MKPERLIQPMEKTIVGNNFKSDRGKDTKKAFEAAHKKSGYLRSFKWSPDKGQIMTEATRREMAKRQAMTTAALQSEIRACEIEFEKKRNSFDTRNGVIS